MCPLILNDHLINYCKNNELYPIGGIFYKSPSAFRYFQAGTPRSGKNMVCMPSSQKEKFWSLVSYYLNPKCLYSIYTIFNIDFSACHLNILLGIYGQPPMTWSEKFKEFLEWFPQMNPEVNPNQTFTIEMFKDLTRMLFNGSTWSQPQIRKQCSGLNPEEALVISSS